MTAQGALLDVLMGLEPKALVAVNLLRDYRESGEMPTDGETLSHATRELIAYTGACEKMAGQLVTLQPVPAADPALVEEYPL